MKAPLIALIGGFLGAGKTSLIVTASRILQSRGLRVAAIMNDQDAGLVDTNYSRANNINTGEVAGGCFCCRFSDLLDVADQLKTYDPEVILAEPVGSCIDLSATIVQPLKLYHSQDFQIAPITVLIDPDLAYQVFSGKADSNIEYLFRNQIQEADILCSTKSDIFPSSPTAQFPLDFALSSKTGDGVDLWLDEVLHGGRIAGAQPLQVDYSRYADAEAALGWLNLHAHVHLYSALSPAVLIGPLLEDLAKRLTESGIHIAHLKLFDRTPTGFIKASLCANEAEPQADGDLLADPSMNHELVINLRAIADPTHLAEIVSEVLTLINGRVEVTHQNSFRPAPPTPQHRIATTDDSSAHTFPRF